MRAWRAAVAPAANAPVIVAVHGVGVSSRYLRPVLQALAPGHEVWAPDLPGFGQSVDPPRVFDVGDHADALAAWMTTVGVRHPVLLANSFGCQVAIDLAQRYPDRVTALVLIGPTVDPSGHGWTPQIGRWLLNATAEPNGLGVTLLRDLRDAGIGRLATTFAHALRDRPKQKAAGIAVPALVVRGAKDRIVSAGWVEQLADSFPRGRALTIADGAHSVHYSDPGRVASEVTGFLDAEGVTTRSRGR